MTVIKRGRAVLCPVCCGKGKVNGKLCHGCNGKGWVTVYDEIIDYEKREPWKRGLEPAKAVLG